MYGKTRTDAGHGRTASQSAGNPGKRPLMVIGAPEAAALECVDMPAPKDYVKEKQKNGGAFCAEEIYMETWEWLKERCCEKLVKPQLIERYAMSVSHWIQCEQAISEFGFLAKHPTTQQAIASPFVNMAQSYMKLSNQMWAMLYQTVKENCSTEYQSQTPQDSVMERLLRAREGLR